MNFSFGDISTWHEVVTVVLVSLIVALPSALSLRNHKQLRKLDGSISNGHTGPLRADIDEMRNTLSHIRNDLHHVRTEIGDVRADLNDERRERARLAEQIEKL